jgi:predicted AAA+ superfamily ATPase
MLNREVDFIAKKQDRILYVQSSWTIDDDATAAREYRPLEAITDNYSKIIVSMDDIAKKNRNGIENVQAWKLEDYLGIE